LLNENTFFGNRIWISDAFILSTSNCWVGLNWIKIFLKSLILRHILEILSKVKISKTLFEIIHLSPWTNNLYRFIEVIIMFKFIKHHLWSLYHIFFWLVKPLRQNWCLICVLIKNIWLGNIVFDQWTLNINSQSTFLSKFNAVFLNKSVDRKVLSWLGGGFDSKLNHEIDISLDFILICIYLTFQWISRDSD